MNQRSIDEIVTNPIVKGKLKEVNLLSVDEIIHLSELELQVTAGLSKNEARLLLLSVSRTFLKSKPIDISSSNEAERRWLYFGVPQTPLSDDSPTLEITQLQMSEFKHHPLSFIRICSKSITEIVGAAGAGKTQLCLHLCIQAQLPKKMGGFRCGVVYICTEGAFPVERYMQLVKGFLKMWPQFDGFNFMDNLLIKKVQNFNHAMFVLEEEIPKLDGQHRLVIVDSVAALLRCEFEMNCPDIRNKLLQQLSCAVCKLVNVLGMTLICVNQVTGELSSCPSLGLMWSNILNTRLFVNRMDTSVTEITHINCVPRMLKVVFSSYLPPVCCNFIITQDGLISLKPNRNEKYTENTCH